MLTRQIEQLAHHTVAFGVFSRRATPLDFAQAMPQRLDQHASTIGVVQQVVLQIRIALHHPDVAQHFVEHACRSAGTTLLPQTQQQLPRLRTEQTDDDLAGRKRGVVVGNLAQTGVIRSRVEQLI